MSYMSLDRMARLSLGDAMQLFGVTARALRFYEEAGLVVARRDRRNHRYYDHDARQRIGWIVALRAAGVPLRAIEETLRCDSETARRKVARVQLQRRLDAATAELGRVHAAIARFDAEALDSAA